MTSPYLLMVAPYAPPVNAAEAIQARRLLAALDSKTRGHLVRVAPTTGGWAAADDSLALPLQHFTQHALRLPLHSITSRLLGSRYAAHLHRPDHLWWIQGMAEHILHRLPQTPDILYSRSYPISAALLALRLKQALDIPWIMHLSDPWADNPYTAADTNTHAQEAACFTTADHITLTTSLQLAHYQRKYPHHAHKLSLSANMLPQPAELPATTHANDERLHIVFTGNLYGARTIEPLLRAVSMLPTPAQQRLRIDIYGHAAHLDMLHSLPDIVQYHGPVPFREAMAAQAASDIILSIEPVMPHALANAFLPSKLLEAMALGKPLAALTPAGSEAERLCDAGHGWALDPTRPEQIAAWLQERIASLQQLRTQILPAPPAQYGADYVADHLLAQMQQLLGRNA